MQGVCQYLEVALTKSKRRKHFADYNVIEEDMEEIDAFKLEEKVYFSWILLHFIEQ